MTIYARQPGSDTWHFSRECRKYPVAHDTIRRETRPVSGLLCLDCKALTEGSTPQQATARPASAGIRRK